MTSMPTIYLPVEIKAHELNAKVLLSLCAAREGFRVYLGTKAAVDRLLANKTNYGGIYFYKGGKPADVLKKIKEKCQYFVVLDEEMGPAVHDLEGSYQRRIYPGTESCIDKLFVIGELHREIIARIRPQLLEKVVVTGWPRVDIWRAGFKGGGADRAREIRQCYGDFLLFSSDFGVLSEKMIARELRRMHRIETDIDAAHGFEQFMRDTYADFHAFVDLIKQSDRDPDFPKILIRPHPSEDIAEWQRCLGRLEKHQVVFEGAIDPWLNASSGLLHRGCTTAVQAFIAGLPVVYYVGGKLSPKQDTLPYRVSYLAHDYAELKSFARGISTGTLAAKQAVDVGGRVSMDETLASQKIAVELREMAAKEESVYRCPVTQRLWHHVEGHLMEWRDAFGALRGERRAKKAQRKRGGGIRRHEVVTIAESLVPLMLEGNFKIVECDFNLYEIAVEGSA